jgi:tetratricopeptide (TPR) repeat protein
MPTPDALSRSRRIFIILVLALVAYWPTLRLGFLWDDHVMIESNPVLREWSISNLKQDFSRDPFSGMGDPYYRPLQTLANRVDYTFWGLHPFGYHLTNLLFHMANSVLIGELVIALGFSPLVALLAGCLFGVHPIVVEQLMIIAGRAELMALCFSLMNLLLFIQEGSLFLIAGSIVYLLALFSKESAIMTPILFLLVAWFRKKQQPLSNRLWIYLAITGLYLVARSLAVGSRLPSIPPLYAGRFFVQAFPKILAVYFRLILVPWNLHSHRMTPHLSHVWFLYAAVWLGLAAWLMRRKIRWAAFSLAWFILTLLPKTPAMIVGNFTLDHWAYSAAFGIILPLSIGFVWCWENPRPRWRYGLAVAFFPLLIAWALLVHLNVELRGTDEKMYRWALNFTGSHPIKYNLGVLLLQTGRAEESLQYFQDVLTTYPDDIHAAHAMAIAFWQTGHQQAALSLLERIVKANPSYRPAAQSLERMRAENGKELDGSDAN